jgi:glycosyltransferase involved in cell wall biosynthesis
VLFAPAGDPHAKSRWLRQQLHAIQPDAIWAQEEPINYYVLEILRSFRFKRPPRIVVAVVENIFPRAPWRGELRRRLFWPRIDVLLANATASMEGLWAAGMPRRIPFFNLAMGFLSPPAELTPLPLPFQRATDTFVVGFAGRITEEKGWRDLLLAVEQSPSNIACILAGDGPQVDELKQWLQRRALQGRAFYLGLLPKATLWRFYAAADCLAVPSVDTPRWKEQFGGVIADATAMGLPLIGTASGAIPEVMGPAGIVVPQHAPGELAAAIGRLAASSELRQQLGSEGKRRFQEEFSIPAFTAKLGAALGVERLS